jgi:hypothetical protein
LITDPAADPRAVYESRLAFWRERTAALDRTHLLISNGRLVLACAGAVLLWMAFVTGAVSALWPLAVWLVFGALVVFHARVLLKVDRAKNGSICGGRIGCLAAGTARVLTVRPILKAIRMRTISTSSGAHRCSN